MRLYNEYSGVEFVAWFTATPGVPTVPTTVHWRLRCTTNDQVLQDWTTVAPSIQSDNTGITGVKAAVDVPGSLNGIINRANRREIKQLQVVADKDTDREYSVIREWYVLNTGER